MRESEALVLKWNPSWKLAGFNGMYPWLVDKVLEHPAIRLREQFCYDHERAMIHAGWRARMRTCNGVGSGGMDAATVERFDADLAALLAEHYPEPLLAAPTACSASSPNGRAYIRDRHPGAMRDRGHFGLDGSARSP